MPDSASDHIESEELDAVAAEVISADFVRTAGRWRQPRSAVQAFILVAVFAAIPAIPGLQSLSSVPVWLSFLCLGGWGAVLLVASALQHKRDPREKLGEVLGWFDTGGWCVGNATLIAASDEIVNIYWVNLGFLIVVLSAAVYRHRTHLFFLSGSLVGLCAYLLWVERGEDAFLAALIGAAMIFAQRSSTVTGWRVARLRARTQILGDRAAALLVQLERERIAQDLHDGVAAELTSALWMAHGEEAESEVASQIQRSLSSLRSVVKGRSSGSVGLRDAVEQIESACLRLSTSDCPVEVKVSGESADRLISGECAEHWLRVAQEGVRNAARHAKATVIRVDLKLGEELCLQIDDNGQGLDVDPASRSQGGLHNLRLRAELLGGRIEWTPLRPGTRLLFEAPVRAMAPEPAKA